MVSDVIRVLSEVATRSKVDGDVVTAGSIVMLIRLSVVRFVIAIFPLKSSSPFKSLPKPFHKE